MHAEARRAVSCRHAPPVGPIGRAQVSGDFLTAASTWLRAMEEPSRGAEKYTEVDVEDLEGDAPALANMVDYLFLENESLLVFVAHLDVETIREAVKGWGTEDTPLIRAFATRNKRALARINIGQPADPQTPRPPDPQRTPRGPAGIPACPAKWPNGRLRPLTAMPGTPSSPAATDGSQATARLMASPCRS